EEVGRLPEKYRTAVALCYVAGLTTAEAARRIGCPVGTVLSRLAWARGRLRDRLTRRGVAPAAAGALAGAPPPGAGAGAAGGVRQGAGAGVGFGAGGGGRRAEGGRGSIFKEKVEGPRPAVVGGGGGGGRRGPRGPHPRQRRPGRPPQGRRAGAGAGGRG